MLCLDTDFIVALLRRRPEADDRLEEYARRGQSVSTTTITACELYRGACRSRDREKEVAKVSSILRSVKLLTLTNESCMVFGQLSSHPELATQPLSDLDLLIASIVLTANETLVTKNVRHFSRVPNLKLEPW